MRLSRSIKAISERCSHEEDGYVLVISLFAMFILTLIGIALIVVGINEIDLSARATMMDQGYAISEAGVNRAAVELKLTPSYTQSLGPIYPASPAQWGPFTESFGGGSYTVTMWQDNLAPDDYNRKVIQSKGVYNKGGRSVERTIETRISFGGNAEEYVAAFDYCIFNGNNTNSSASWPGVSYWFADFEVDGASRYPSEYAGDMRGALPRGAIYTKGNMDIPSRLAASAKFHGNIVATGDIKIGNAYDIDAFRPGVLIDDKDKWGQSVPGQGNVIAGIDGSGSALMETRWIAGLGQNSLKVEPGYVCAANNVQLDSKYSVSFSDPMRFGGLMAGNDVEVISSTGVEIVAELSLGKVFSSGKTFILTAWGKGVRFDSINAGRDSQGLGVHLESKYFGGIGGLIGGPAGPIWSQGKVAAKTTVGTIALGAAINVGDICAGTDTGAAPNYLGGTGVDFDIIVDDIITGTITSRGRVNIDCTNIAYSLSGSRISAGTDASSTYGGTGVDVNLVSGGYVSFPSGITSTGKVKLNGGAAVSTIGNVAAGTDNSSGSGGSGIEISTGGIAVSVSNLTATGTIALDAGGLGAGLGSMHSGNDVNVNFGAVGFGIGSVTAVRDINFGTGGVGAGFGDFWAGRDANFNWGGVGAGVGNIRAGRNADIDVYATVGGVGIGRIQTNGNLNFDLYAIVAGGGSINGVLTGGNASINNHEWGLFTLLTINRLGGAYGNGDAMWCGGNATLRAYGAWVLCNFELDGDSTLGWGDCEAAGSISTGGGGQFYYSDVNDYRSWLSGWSPGVSTPSTPAVPARPSMPSYSGGFPSGTADWLNRTPPVVSQSLLLHMAGLQRPVELPEPNWTYFEQCAVTDDLNHQQQYPGDESAPHVLKDTGDPKDGDWSAKDDGIIYFKWRPNELGQKYSSNETIYQPDPTKLIWLNVNWAGKGADFTGTLASKGNILLTNHEANWLTDTSQELNLVSGGSITSRVTGLTLWSTQNNRFHWYAKDNIDLRNIRLAFGSSNTYYGSFTSGNRLYYDDNTFWTGTDFRWSRWALDPSAWLPPMKILTWKEI